MVHATQTTVPKTEHVLGMQVSGSGVDFHLAIQVPTLIGQNVERCLLDAFRGGDDGDDDDGAHLPSPLSGNGKWNDLFWVVHPGGRQILDNIDKVLQLEPEKLGASRHVLREYGNMSGATIVFVLDELRRRRSLLPEWGAMLAFGPGVTIETMLYARVYEGGGQIILESQKMKACKEGLALALERTTCPIQVELDCSEAVVMLN
ncbi:Curcuminoid synthase [Triticum urartu]|uniref:Curcuminoid synthase n=1 Tax=Triticum urartu TaxID=4572 RepID=M7YJT4_TRIUA|nr:Curcuminoid synthase [Triticum urartu]